MKFQLKINKLVFVDNKDEIQGRTLVNQSVRTEECKKDCGALKGMCVWLKQEYGDDPGPSCQLSGELEF